MIPYELRHCKQWGVVLILAPSVVLILAPSVNAFTMKTFSVNGPLNVNYVQETFDIFHTKVLSSHTVCDQNKAHAWMTKFWG